MTGAQWRAAKDVTELQLYRVARGRYRKNRLYGVACCRAALHLVPADPRHETLLRAAEQLADDAITWGDMKPVRRLLAALGKDPSTCYSAF